jgi:hypothetical protein
MTAIRGPRRLQWRIEGRVKFASSWPLFPVRRPSAIEGMGGIAMGMIWVHMGLVGPWSFDTCCIGFILAC